MAKYQNLEKFTLPNNFRGRPGWFVQLWWIVQSLFFNTTPQFMYGWRRFLLRVFGAKIGLNVLIRPSVKVQFPWKVTIGNNTWIGDEVVLYSLGPIVIGENVVISQRSYICGGSHNYEKDDFPIYSAEIRIGDECWLATDVYVAPGVFIGKASVIGARSSVFKSIPPNTVCVGSPAKPIKSRTKYE